ncbi:MAG: C39 family peptidase [Armatimonadetes bacterium]|nr:C39 family peptidase [Armatimonadota bacterium]
MIHCKKSLATSIALALSLMVLATIAPAGVSPKSSKIEGVIRTKQITNYCGPATMTSVLRHYGKSVTQEMIGTSIFDSTSGATNGADMLLYARNLGFAAYSWNSSIEDVKLKIAAGIPVIALQQNSSYDTSGHYRVFTGFNDATQQFSVMDPYYDDITALAYSRCEQLWKSMGYWALAIIPADKDTFKTELNDNNPVVHMDLAQVLYKRKDYDNALKEAKIALALEPGNPFTTSLMGKIRGAESGKRRAESPEGTLREF